MKKRLFLFLILILIAGCSSEETIEEPRAEEGLIDTSKPYERFYSDDSPFNQKIPSHPEIDPNSDLMIGSLKEAGMGENLITVSIGSWTTTLFYADENTPRYDVKLTAYWSPYKKLLNVPIPDNAVQDPSDDGSMVVIDLSTGYEYDFWQARKTKNGWQASWANRIKLDSDGVFEKGTSARGSGFALPAGLIRAEELQAGRIEHALFFTYTFTKSNGPVPPATESDGQSKRDDAIPEGARLQLDPNLDLDILGLTPAEKIIAKALQEYGMFLGDSGGGVELEAINPLSYKSNPYKQYFETDKEGLYYTRNIPLDKFRVLKLPPQYEQETEVMEPGIYSNE